MTTTLPSRLVGGMRGLFIRKRLERELDEELRAYLADAVEQKIAAGMTREDAVRAARVDPMVALWYE